VEAFELAGENDSSSLLGLQLLVEVDLEMLCFSKNFLGAFFQFLGQRKLRTVLLDFFVGLTEHRVQVLRVPLLNFTSCVVALNLLAEREIPLQLYHDLKYWGNVSNKLLAFDVSFSLNSGKS